LLTRKHLTWGIYLDMPVALTPGQAPGTGTRIIRMTLTGEPGSTACRDTAGEGEARLVNLGITNPGFAPIRRALQYPVDLRIPRPLSVPAESWSFGSGRPIMVTLPPRLRPHLPGGIGRAVNAAHDTTQVW